ncbi:hypothetical protein [Microbacterium sp. No. 7]|uniref:hypothetical protein n=1 Tax=Microbacterium sp. No. 7 TaxID=1714373 RepID=UPI0006D1A6E7|nr:hypothetical protein [Microbacterium sp. No. 7]ALJ21656.1 hypothetical protein AOA12_17865 [Microbacterium sp. No. 7]
MTTSESHIDAQGEGLPRRTLLRAGAWMAPVIAVTAAVPLAAASDTPSGVELVSPPYFEIDEIGDTVPIVFSVTAVAAGSAATATILQSGPVAQWESGQAIEVGTVDGDGEVVFIAETLGEGTFTVTLAVGGYTSSFALTIVLA